VIVNYIGTYTPRLHSSIDYLPPIEFEHRHRQAKTTTPSPEVA
jgi:putative transposase